MTQTTILQTPGCIFVFTAAMLQIDRITNEFVLLREHGKIYIIRIG